MRERCRASTAAGQPPGWRSRGAKRESWRITRPAGLWEITFGEAQSRRANIPKVSAGFNTVRDTPEWGHHCHPPRAPSALAKVNPQLAQPHGCFTSQQAGKLLPAQDSLSVLPPGCHSSPTANPEGLSIARGSPPSHVKGKTSGYKKGHGTALCPLHWGALTATFPIFSPHPCGYKPTLPTTRS